MELEDFEKQVDEHRLEKLRELVNNYNALPIDASFGYPYEYTQPHKLTRRSTVSTIIFDTDEADPVVYIIALWLRYVDIPEVLTFDHVQNDVFKHYLSRINVLRTNREIRQLGIYHAIVNPRYLKLFAFSMINYEQLRKVDPTGEFVNRALMKCGYKKIHSLGGGYTANEYRRILISRLVDPDVDKSRLAPFLVDLGLKCVNVVNIQDYYEFASIGEDPY